MIIFLLSIFYYYFVIRISHYKVYIIQFRGDFNIIYIAWEKLYTSMRTHVIHSRWFHHVCTHLIRDSRRTWFHQNHAFLVMLLALCRFDECPSIVEPFKEWPRCNQPACAHVFFFFLFFGTDRPDIASGIFETRVGFRRGIDRQEIILHSSREVFLRVRRYVTKYIILIKETDTCSVK